MLVVLCVCLLGWVVMFRLPARPKKDTEIKNGQNTPGATPGPGAQIAE